MQKKEYFCMHNRNYLLMLRVVNAILDVFFPRTCPACGQLLGEHESICEECLSKLERTQQALYRDNVVETIFEKEKHFSYGGSWLWYQKGTYLQKMIHMAKFGRGNPLWLEQMGREAAKEWEEYGFFDGIDVIVPIPLHPKRLRIRGFNQSEAIAKGMSDVLKIPMDTDHLTREVNNRKQSQSSKIEREHLKEGLFKVNHPEEWYEKTIMLVDDIITTGATFRAATHALKDVYNCKIVIFSLAKTK